MRFSAPATCVALFSMILLSAALPLDPQDAYAPPVLYPHRGAVWQTGARYNVTWYTPSTLVPYWC